jgi:hypothetical protein
MTSVPLPAPNGTTIVMYRCGQSCAAATATAMHDKMKLS